MKRTLKTMAALAALAWLIPSTTASAQEEKTIEEALEELQREIERGASSFDHPYLPAVYILRQVSAPRRGRVYTRPRPATELDAFADRLAAMAADATLPEHVRRNAYIALAAATRSESGHGSEGTPYARGFDLLVQVYESGNDVLHLILSVDPERGPAYLQDVFERSERPPLCRWSYDSDRYEPPECVRGHRTFHKTTWCRAGEMLYWDTVSRAWDRTPGGQRARAAGYPAPVPDGLPEHIEDWHRRCR